MIRTLLAFFFVLAQQAYCELCGKVDTGPIYVSIDKLEDGHTIETFNLWGVKSDAILVFDNGIGIKPSAMVGFGAAKFFNLGIGAGVCMPVAPQLNIFPNAGIFFGKFVSHIDEREAGLDVDETIRTTTPYVGVDICYRFFEKWFITAVVQYSWSKVRTTYHGWSNGWDFEWRRLHATFKDHSQGYNLSLVLERTICDNLSVSLGVGYNTSLSEEKRGLRGKGGKLGLVWRF